MAGSNATAPGQRRPRLSAEETRQLLCDAAHEQLSDVGFYPSVDSVSLETTYRVVNVPRSSAYNAWQKVAIPGQTPQEAFQREVLRQLVLGEGMGTRDTTPMQAETARVLENADNLSADEIRREIIRTVVGAQFESALTRPGYRLALAMTAVATSVPPSHTDEELLGWVRQAEAAWLDFMVDKMSLMALAAGLKPAPDLDGPLFWQQFTTAILAIGEGLYPRMSSTKPEYQLNIMLPGPGGEDQPWTLYAVAFEALFDRFFVSPNDSET